MLSPINLQPDTHHTVSMYRCNRCGQHEHQQMPTNEAQFVCSHCQRVAILMHKNGIDIPINIPKYEIKDPLQDPAKKYKCTECTRTFKSHSSLYLHQKSHNVETTYDCKFCDKTFNILGYYQRHLREHTKEKPYCCDFCGKSFTQPYTLTQHIRIHTGEKPYQCKQCGKAFSVRDYLTKHIRTHTGEKPYECNICGKRYTQQSALKGHQKKHPLPIANQNNQSTADSGGGGTFHLRFKF